jgi:hypothetical protein
MKKLFFLAAFVCNLLAIKTANAQNPITTLEHAGTTTVYYGQNSLVDAYTASVNGDSLYLSTGYFTAPAGIAQSVKIIGAGHFPDSLNVAKRTTIMGGLVILAGADSLRLEGLYINGDIVYDFNNRSVSYVKVIRCRLGNVNLYSGSVSTSKNNCSFEECFILGQISNGSYVVNLLIKNSIIGNIYGIGGSAIITNNIILQDIYYVNTSVIQNNIINGTANFTSNANGNTINNNVFVNSPTDFGYNSYNNNYLGVKANILVNQSGTSIDYAQDYHLINPTTYLGTDSIQVGIYGGTTPFKDKGLPSNPQVISKTVGTQTDVNGNLQINFTVKAQNN